MTIGGWISMTITMGFITGLFGWCCYKMLTAPEAPQGEDEQRACAGKLDERAEE